MARGLPHLRRKVMRRCYSLLVTLFVILNSTVPAQAEQWISLPIAGDDRQARPSGASPTVLVNGLSRADAIAAGAPRYKVVVDLPGVWKSDRKHDEDIYDALNVPGWAAQPDPGMPGVPVKSIWIEIPRDTSPTVSVTSREETALGPMKIWPVQPPPRDNQYDNPPFEKNVTAYEKDELYPADNVVGTSVMWMRNHRVLVVDVAPVRVNAKTGEVLAAGRLELAVTLTPTPPQPEPDNSGPGLASYEYDAVMGAGIFGFEAAPLPESETPSKYMIMMDDQFASNSKLVEFVEWKNRKGYSVVTVKTSQIPASTPGAPNSSEIVNYMRTLPDADYPLYLLTIGTENAANGVAAKYYSTYSGGYTDLDTSCRTGTDWVPDLFCGRLPAASSAELTLMLDKALKMDRTPPSSSMYDKVVVAGMLQDADHNNQEDRLFCETTDAVSSYFEQDAGGVDYSCVRAITNPDGVTSSCLWQSDYTILWIGATGTSAMIGTRVYNTFVTNTEARNRVIGGLNSGIALLLHRDHGATDGWGDPSFSTSDVTALANAGNLPLVLSISCLTGAYHVSGNFTKPWLVHSNGGAYAVVSATDASYSGYNDWLTHGFLMGIFGDYRNWIDSSINPDWTSDLPSYSGGGEGTATNVGPMMDFGKMYTLQNEGADTYTHETFELFHVFGDPEAQIQLHTPATRTVSHPSAVPAGASSVVVTTGDSGSLVCLYGDTVGVHKVGVTSGGSAAIDINPTGIGPVHVTVTKFGARPYEGTMDQLPDTVSVMPGANFAAKGPLGGPFVPDSQQYTLTSTSTTMNLDWSVSHTQSWIDVAPSSGALEPGASTTVTVSINSGANVLPLGTHSDAVSFTNLTNGNGNTTRSVDLLVNSPPKVVSSSIREGDVLASSALTYIAQFDEEIEGKSLSGAFTLTGAVNGPVTGGMWSYNPTTLILTVNWPALAEDYYTLTLISGDGKFEDKDGGNLDGETPAWPIPPNTSGDGMEGGDFVVHFIVDRALDAYPVPLSSVNPAGSLVYRGQVVSGVVAPAADVDGFTIGIDAGQTITVSVKGNGGLQPQVEVLDPSSNPVGSAFAATPDSEVVLHCAPAASDGTYTVNVSGVGDTTGSYTLQLVLNAALEDEEHGGATNDVLATAQNLDAGFVAVSSVSRGAVLGKLPPTTGVPYVTEDFESGSLGSNWSTYESTNYGRIQLSGAYGKASGAYAMLMDRTSSGTYNLNEAVWTVDLSTTPLATLTFYHASFNDENHSFAGDYTGHYNADGVSISSDGVMWHPVLSGPNLSYGVWTKCTVDLAAAAASAGMALGPGFKIKFQQYDDYALTTDGRGYDDIVISVPSVSEDWFSFTLSAGDSVSMVLKKLSAGSAALELYDSSGVLIAKGSGSTANVDDHLTDYISVAGGTHYVRVAGNDAEYSLVVVRNGGFGIESDDVPAAALDISGTGAALGAIAASAPFIATESEPNDDGILGCAPADFTYADDLSGSFVPMGASYQTAISGVISAGNDADWDFYKVYASPGDTLVLDMVGTTLDDTYLRLFDKNGVQIAYDDDGGAGYFSHLVYSAFAYAGAYYVVSDSFETHTGGYTLTAELTTNDPLATDEDCFRFEVSAGDNLTITTSTPAGGNGEFVNTLDSLLKLYDSSGTLVASDDNSAPDGRNASIVYTALTSGTYTVRISAAAGAGEYVLNVAGNTGGLPAFRVTASNPYDGYSSSVVPSSILADFSSDVLTSTLSASDLTVDGSPASGFTLVDNDTVKFDLPALGLGPHNIAIAAGAISSLQGALLEQFTVAITILPKPCVTSSSVQDGAILLPGDLTYTVQFNREMNSAVIDTSDFTLVGALQGFVNVTSWDYDPATHTLTLSYSALPEDVYTLTLKSGNGKFEDIYGTDLDGEVLSWPIPPNVSGNGVEGGDFVVNFTVDIVTAQYPVPLVAKSPKGSLIYDPVVTGTVVPAGDTDTYAIDLDSGQTITVIAGGSGGLKASVEVLDPVGTSLGTASAGSAGGEAVLQALPAATAGEYSVIVSGAGGTQGGFSLTLVLNSVVEEEAHGGPGNNTLSEAQDIDGSFTALTGSGKRAAVLGKLGSGALVPVFTENFTTTTLGPAWSTYKSTSNGRIQITGSYGTASGSYAMLMDTSYYTVYNLNEAILTVDLTGRSQALLTFKHAEWSDVEQQFSGDYAGHANADGVSISANGTNWHPVWNAPNQSTSGAWLPYTLDIAAAAAAAGMQLGSNFKIKFQQYDDDYLTYHGRGYDEIVLTASSPADDWYGFTSSAGDCVTLAVTALNAGSAAIELRDTAGSLLKAGSTGVNVTSVVTDYAVSAAGRYYAHVTGMGADYTLVVTRNLAFDLESNDTPAQAQDISATGAALGAISATGDVDVYSIAATANETVTIQTATPADGANEFVNVLDPVLELLDPSGTLVASDDNGASDGRNAKIIYPVLVSGTYKIRVLASSGTGEYVVTSISDNYPPAANDDAFTGAEDVVLTVPAPGVLGNDTDPDGDSFTATAETSPVHGTLVLTSDGSFTYTPALNWNGTDSFVYKAVDEHGKSASASVSITMTPVNDNPVAVDDVATTVENTTVHINVLLNDSDLDGDALAVVSVTDGSFGTCSIDADGLVRYTPGNYQNGSDSFVYTVSDGHGGVANATVVVTVIAINNPPVAVDDSDTTSEDVTVTIPVLANDTDPEGDALSATDSVDPQHGHAHINGDGTITYLPDPDFSGMDNFTYTITDGHGGFSTATVTITVVAVDDPPVAEAGTDREVTVGTTVTLDGSGSHDPDSTVLTYSWAQVSGPVVTLNSPQAVTTTFVAPQLVQDEVLTFELTVSDGTLSGTDQVNSTVKGNDMRHAGCSVSPQPPRPGDVVGWFIPYSFFVVVALALRRRTKLKKAGAAQPMPHDGESDSK